MMQSKLMKNNRFTFFMADTEGSKAKSGIWFDDVPKSLFKGELRKHPVMAKGYWSVKLLDIKVGGKPTGVCGDKGCKAAVDSGTSLLTAPSRIAKTVLGAIAANQEQLADVGASPDEWVDVMACQSLKHSPKLTYVIEAESADGSKHAVDYELTPEEYMLEDSPGCGRAALSSLDVPAPNGPVVILGDIFMSKYLSVFDRDTDAVYIGKADQSSNKEVLFTSEATDSLLESKLVQMEEIDNWT